MSSRVLDNTTGLCIVEPQVTCLQPAQSEHTATSIILQLNMGTSSFFCPCATASCGL